MIKLTKKVLQQRVDTLLSASSAESKPDVKVLRMPKDGEGTLAKFRCSIHGVFYRSKNQIGSSSARNPNAALVCQTCSRIVSDRDRIAKRFEKYKKQLKESHNGTLKIVGKYTDQKTPVDIKCTVCGTVCSVLPCSKIKHGCRVCANARRQHTVGKNINLDGKNFKIEGYEGHALKYILQATDLKAKDIECASSGKVPPVPYTFKDEGKKSAYSHYYHPDFYVKKTNTIIEVKSTTTLGIHTPFLYQKNRAKAKACVAAGYNHMLVLVLLKQGTVVVEKWYKKGRKSFLRTLREEYLLKI